VAGFKSERRPASDRNRWPASYWNAWPASSESAHGEHGCAASPDSVAAIALAIIAFDDYFFDVLRRNRDRAALYSYLD
jgi:hypothetical protein